MEVISGNISSSTLNPNAPAFIPSAYRDVEDFSDEWWSLVNSSPWFRDYWFRECFADPEDLLETDDFSINDQKTKVNEDKESDFRKDLVALGVLKWRNGRVAAEKPRCFEKAPKIVNVRVSPRLIQQPR